LPSHASVSQLTSPPDSVLSKCRRSRRPFPTQIATAPLSNMDTRASDTMSGAALPGPE
jgi:hypothetical protein